MDNQVLKKEIIAVLNDFNEQVDFQPNQVMVIGCSTSEVMGDQIGSSGSDEVARVLFEELNDFANKTGIQLAFQCCEHLNRALVVETDVKERLRLEEVAVIPAIKAGGQMATNAYNKFDDPCVVEHILADYGIDIGDTLIGMHLKHVAVPVRVSKKSIGAAHITLARTRPKLIGGERARYCL